MSSPHHAVHFYETDPSLVDAVGGFFAEGLERGETAVCVATPAHLEQVAASLCARGHDFETHGGDDVYFSLDASELLSRFMVSGAPEGMRFERTLHPIMKRATAGGRSVRIYGEMVALLWAEGDRRAALRLEELWNEAIEVYPFSLLCGYPAAALVGEGWPEALDAICERHTHVLTAPAA